MTFNCVDSPYIAVESTTMLCGAHLLLPCAEAPGAGEVIIIVLFVKAFVKLFLIGIGFNAQNIPRSDNQKTIHSDMQIVRPVCPEHCPVLGTLSSSSRGSPLRGLI